MTPFVGRQTAGPPRGLKVCESLVKRCPFCGRTYLRLVVGVVVAGWHTVLCRNCGGTFGVPCQD